VVAGCWLRLAILTHMALPIEGNRLRAKLSALRLRLEAKDAPLLSSAELSEVIKLLGACPRKRLWV